MKTFSFFSFLLLSGLLAVGPALAQVVPAAPALNHVRTWTARQAGLGPRAGTAAQPVNPATAPPFTDITNALTYLPTAQRAVQTTYVNGMGQVVQVVNRQASPWGQDVVQPRHYDAMGRETTQPLPYVYGGNGEYQPDHATQQPLFYQQTWDHTADDTHPWTRTDYELAGPESRPLRTSGGPGAAWQPGTDHDVRFTYRANGAPATEPVRRFTWETVQAALAPGAAPLPLYAANEVRVRQTTDADNRLTVDYTDAEGRLVLKKAQISGGVWAETAYAYDLFGRLRLVLQPEGNAALTQGAALTASLLRRWAFQYDFDARGRRARSYVPGGADTWYVYGTNNQVILTGQLPANTPEGAPAAPLEWHGLKYDLLDRPVMTYRWAPAATVTVPVPSTGQPPGQTPTTYPPAPLPTDPAEARAVLQAMIDGSLRWFAGTELPIGQSSLSLAALTPLYSNTTGRWPETTPGEAFDSQTRAYTLTNTFPRHGLTESQLLTRAFYDTYNVAARPATHVFEAVEISGNELNANDSSHPDFIVRDDDVSAHTTGLLTVQQERILGNASLWLTTRPGTTRAAGRCNASPTCRRPTASGWRVGSAPRGNAISRARWCSNSWRIPFRIRPTRHPLNTPFTRGSSTMPPAGPRARR